MTEQLQNIRIALELGGFNPNGFIVEPKTANSVRIQHPLLKTALQINRLIRTLDKSDFISYYTWDGKYNVVCSW